MKDLQTAAETKDGYRSLTEIERVLLARALRRGRKPRQTLQLGAEATCSKKSKEKAR